MKYIEGCPNLLHACIVIYNILYIFPPSSQWDCFQVPVSSYIESLMAAVPVCKFQLTARSVFESKTTAPISKPENIAMHVCRPFPSQSLQLHMSPSQSPCQGSQVIPCRSPSPRVSLSMYPSTSQKLCEYVRAQMKNTGMRMSFIPACALICS